MIKRLLLVVMLGLMLPGCYMVPMAFIGPITQGFSTASLIQTGVTTGANFMVKRSTGKTIGEHAFEAINKDIIQAYKPKENIGNTIITP